MKKIFTILGVVVISIITNAQVVINEVYGGGGNSGALLKNDFIELYNGGNTPVTLTETYIQYGSATSVFGGTGSTPTIYALPTPITIPAGKYYLIQAAAGTGGSIDLPTVDATIAASISGTTGKIALTKSSTAVTSANDPSVIDLIGWGPTATIYEGSGPAPIATNTTSISRIPVGYDTNNNATNFLAGTPTPTNSLGTTVQLAVSDFNKSNFEFIKNTVIGESISFAKNADIQIVNTAGQVVKTAKVTEGSTLNVSALAKGTYIVTGTVNGERVSQKVIKN